MAEEKKVIPNTELFIRIATLRIESIVTAISLRSLPVPVMRPDGFRISFFYCPIDVQPDGQANIKSPFYLLYIDADCVFERIQKIKPSDLGQDIGPGKAIGSFEIPEVILPAKDFEDESGEETDADALRIIYEEKIKDKLLDLFNRYYRNELLSMFLLPEGMTIDQYILNMDRLYVLYDKLIPEFISGKFRISDERRANVNEFRELFSLLNAPCLLPYYNSIGGNFFRWLDVVSVN